MIVRGRVAIAVVLALACAALGYGAKSLAGISWDGVAKYQSPYLASDPGPARASSQAATMTIMVIVDGLRADAADTMGTFRALRSYGANVTLTPGQPSLSYPNWTALLSGASPSVSGVTTNWFTGRVGVETLFDTAARVGARTAFVGPEDFDTLYGVRTKVAASYVTTYPTEYASDQYVTQAIRIAKGSQPRFMLIHLPDADTVAHEHGGVSSEYSAVVTRIDGDLNRLVSALQGPGTVFVVTADHGHVDAGGHGGWEPSVLTVPCVIAGPGVRLGTSSGPNTQLAPTVAVLAGIPAPRYAESGVLPDVFVRRMRKGVAAANDEYRAFGSLYIRTLEASMPAGGAVTAAQIGSDAAPRQVSVAMEKARAARLAAERRARLPYLAFALVGLVWFVGLALVSRRVAMGAAAGLIAYYTVYDALFFWVHRYQWSLSAFNEESQVSAWMNMRLIEAACATLVAAVVAAFVLRVLPVGRREEGAERFAAGPATALTILGFIGIQVAWFVWQWGVLPSWSMPDLKWAFKYDLDLIQATAVGFAALLTPLAGFLGKRRPQE